MDIRHNHLWTDHTCRGLCVNPWSELVGHVLVTDTTELATEARMDTLCQPRTPCANRCAPLSPIVHAPSVVALPCGTLSTRLASRGGDRPLEILTHCNAGWLATVDWGTALAPVYRLHDDGVPVHVWVSETRPRNQGLLTAWELGQHGVPFTLLVDNAAGLLLSGGKVDLCLVGADRITRRGDVCNKIGTSLKALAAADAEIPFYVAAPVSTIDWALDDPARIPIEERDAAEVTVTAGLPVFNPGFDVTPARRVTAIITEWGVSAATAEGLATFAPG